MSAIDTLRHRLEAERRRMDKVVKLLLEAEQLPGGGQDAASLRLLNGVMRKIVREALTEALKP